MSARLSRADPYVKSCPMTRHAPIASLSLALTLIFLCLAGGAAAQDRTWIQIEARPSIVQAEERARLYADRFGNVEGYRLPSGWFAIVLGPYAEGSAAPALAQLRATLRIPGDSFLADGSAFQQQFWPPPGQRAAAPITVAPLPGRPDPAAPADTAPAADGSDRADGSAATPQALQADPPAGETVAEARAAERLLTRPEREEIQRALAWEGYYTAGIDGAFGPGTRRAIESWQIANAREVTGVLRTRERQELVDGYRRDVASLGLRSVTDRQAGITITLPMALVGPPRAEAPFVEYPEAEASGVRVLLISQPGDRATLSALYEVMQALDIVPVTGPRELDRRSFTLTGEDAERVVTAYAEIRDGAVKGYALVWPTGDSRRRQKVLAEMRAGFTPIPDTVLDDRTAALDRATRAALIAGFEIRQPDAALSGIHVDRAGRVLTAAAPLAGCARITTGDDLEMEITAADDALGIALLSPIGGAVPIGVARIDTAPLAAGGEIAVAGYSFGGQLDAPSLTFGRVEALSALDGREAFDRLALAAAEGDVGGALLDSVGAVRGLLLPVPSDGSRRLPDGVRYAADGAAIARFLSAAGVPVETGLDAPALDALALADRASGFTALVRCWN